MVCGAAMVWCGAVCGVLVVGQITRNIQNYIRLDDWDRWDYMFCLTDCIDYHMQFISLPVYVVVRRSDEAF